MNTSLKKRWARGLLSVSTHRKISDEYVIKKSWLRGLESLFLSIKFDPGRGLRAWINMTLLENIPVWIREISENLKTQVMCNQAMRIEPYSLVFVPDYFKTQEMCDKAIEIYPFTLWHVPDNLKTQGMCIKAVEMGLGLLGLPWLVCNTTTNKNITWWQWVLWWWWTNLLSGMMVIKNARQRKQK